MNNIEQEEGAEIDETAQWVEAIQREQDAREQLRRQNFQNYLIECAFKENLHRKVMKAKYLNDTGHADEIVIKMKSASSRRSGREEQSLEREVLALQKLQDEKQFVKLFALLQTSEAETQCYIMNFCAGGDLLKYSVLLNGFEEQDVRYILQEIISILEGLQKHGVAHLNIKPDNILIDNEGNLILGGFSACQLLTSQNQILKETNLKGLSPYYLQEITQQKPFRSSHADIFAAGVTLFQAYSGFQPFDHHADQSVLFGNPNTFWKQMCKKSKNLKFKNELSLEFQDLFVRMVHRDPSKRISLEELRDHPFLKKQAVDKDGFMKTLQTVDNNLNRLRKTQESTSTVLRDNAPIRSEHTPSIDEQYEKYEYQVPNLIVKSRVAKIYTEASIKRSDFCTNIECGILFKFLFTKQEYFSTEVPLMSSKSFKLKCVYDKTNSHKINNLKQGNEEYEDFTIENEKQAEEYIQNKDISLEEDKQDYGDCIQDISKDQGGQVEENNNITGDNTTALLDHTDSSINHQVNDLNQLTNSLVEQECAVLRFTISLMQCVETTKTVVIFANKQGDSFEFYKLISEIQALIVQQFP